MSLNLKQLANRIIISFLILALVCIAPVACLFTPVPAYAITAAEKQAEADEVFAQVDLLQTSLNEAIAQRDAAQAAYEEAERLAAEAAERQRQEEEHLATLQTELSQFAVGMYKDGGPSSFLDVLLQTTSFQSFLTSWDFCSSISNHGSNLIQQTKAAREAYENAKIQYQEQSTRAAEQCDIAEANAQVIAETQEALRAEAQKLSAEAAELQIQEELAAEAARQAEAARIQREAELADAYNSGGTSGYSPGGSVLMGSGFFTHPLPGGWLSSDFGYRTFDYSFHRGIDLAAAEGTPYYAADSGTVLYATNGGGYNGGAGNWIVISHGNGIRTVYMHSLQTFVSPGEYVTRGQNIGLVGNTGNSFGAHLHFQVEVDGIAVNPLLYL